MKKVASKTIDKKLARKNAELQTAMKSRQSLDDKICKLREEIENLQSTQLEQVFQQVKRQILKEGLRIDDVTVSDIMRTVREHKGTVNLTDNVQKADNLSAEKFASSESFHDDIVDKDDVLTANNIDDAQE